jgi:hypothetical protein
VAILLDTCKTWKIRAACTAEMILLVNFAVSFAVQKLHLSQLK